MTATVATFRQIEVERFLRAARNVGARSVEVDLRTLTISMRFPDPGIDSDENPAPDSDAGDGARYGKENWDEE